MRILRATVDRFDVDADGRPVAVLVFDDGQQLVVARDVLPEAARHGAVLQVHFEPDPEAEAQRRAQITALQERLFGPSPED